MMNLISSFRFFKKKSRRIERAHRYTPSASTQVGTHPLHSLWTACCSQRDGALPYMGKLLWPDWLGEQPAYTGSHACYILSSPPTVTLKHLQVSVLKGLPVYPLLHRKSTKSDSMSRSNVRSQHTCFLEQQATWGIGPRQHPCLWVSRLPTLLRKHRTG